ncbi:hypothetical protein K443DRAFT_683684 [Laccaria amethystina LaAM-08-1]|uniref:Uncharacterized protein n=1 Tax=Laccaria amethystina LaAM-08-1 TaxID=1095629 RepID=A0A0C9XEH1_9AGAR|nr:hypothetical protein K443DRAFT_683684 [Laccaria amethystina LaAM-08-1]
MGRDVLQYPPEVRLRYPPGIRRSHGIEYTTPSWVQPRRPDWVRPHPPSWAETQAEKDDGSLLPVRRSRRRQKSRCETLPPLETRARFLAGASPLFVESGSRLRNGSDILLAPRLRTVSSMQGTIGHEHTEYIILKESTRSTQLEDRHEVEHDSPFCDFSRLMQALKSHFLERPKSGSVPPPLVMTVHFPHDKPSDPYHYTLSDLWR